MPAECPKDSSSSSLPKSTIHFRPPEQPDMEKNIKARGKKLGITNIKSCAQFFWNFFFLIFLPISNTVWWYIAKTPIFVVMFCHIDAVPKTSIFPSPPGKLEL
jgi:hypothetical protein